MSYWTTSLMKLVSWSTFVGAAVQTIVNSMMRCRSDLWTACLRGRLVATDEHRPLFQLSGERWQLFEQELPRRHLRLRRISLPPILAFSSLPTNFSTFFNFSKIFDISSFLIFPADACFLKLAIFDSKNFFAFLLGIGVGFGVSFRETFRVKCMRYTYLGSLTSTIASAFPRIFFLDFFVLETIPLTCSDLKSTKP